MFDAIIDMLVPEYTTFLTNYDFIIYMVEVGIRIFLFGYIFRFVSNVITFAKSFKLFD